MIFLTRENRIYLRSGISYYYGFNFRRIIIRDWSHTLYIIEPNFIIKYKVSKSSYKEVVNTINEIYP